MRQSKLAFVRSRGNTLLYVIIVAAVLFVFVGAGVAMAMTLLNIRNRTGETPLISSAFDSCISGACFIKDDYFKDPANGLDAKIARDKLNIPISVPDDKIQKVIDKVRSAGYNPALALATWNKESSYGTDPKNSGDSYGRYEFGYVKEGWGGIDNQIDGYLKTMNWVYNNEGAYSGRPEGKPIQVHWNDIYTPSSDTRNNVPEDRQIVCTVLSKLVPDQLSHPSIDNVVIPCGWNINPGDLDFRKIGPGFDGHVGLWNTIDEAFRALGGRSQSNIERNLVSVNFLGASFRIHRLARDSLMRAQEEIIKSGSSYKITDTDGGGYNWRNNVNNPGRLSPHSTGLALDINPGANGNGRREGGCQPRDPNCCPHNIPKEVSDALEKNGFFWGAKFKNVCDAMHFQFGGNWE